MGLLYPWECGKKMPNPPFHSVNAPRQGPGLAYLNFSSTFSAQGIFAEGINECTKYCMEQLTIPRKVAG